MSVIEGDTEPAHENEDERETVTEGRVLRPDVGDLATKVSVDSRAPEKAGGGGGHQ